MKLISQGADPNTKDEEGNSLLHKLVIGNADGENNAVIEELVIKYNVNINIQNNAGQTPLQYLLKRSWHFPTETAMQLVRLGADPNTKDAEGNSLLHKLAIEVAEEDGEKKAAIEKLVIKYNANINIQNNAGQTTLQCLLTHYYFFKETAMQLVRLGADPNTKDEYGHSLLHELVKRNEDGKNNAAIEKLIKIYHADTSGMMTPLQCMLNGHWNFSAKAVMELISQGADLNTKDEEGNSLLHKLVIDNADGEHNAVIEELVIKYNVNINIQNNDDQTPLQCLMNSLHFSTETAMQLVRQGADPNTKDMEGNSLLHKLVMNHEVKIVMNHEDGKLVFNNEDGKNNTAIEELVNKHHANVNIQNNASKTPLQCLFNCEYFSIENAMKLVRLGANYDESLLHMLASNNEKGSNDAAINELETLPQIPRSNFLNLLIILANERGNKEPTKSFFAILPIDIIFLIVSFMDFGPMKKIWQEGFFLAKEVFSKYKILKPMLSSPGGINVFEEWYDQSKTPTFKFFKSAKILVHDFEKLKTELENKDKNIIPKWKQKAVEIFPVLEKITEVKLTSGSSAKLNELRQDAIPYWNGHSSLYKKPMNKLKLQKSIQDSELYKDIKSQLK